MRESEIGAVLDGPFLCCFSGFIVNHRSHGDRLHNQNIIHLRFFLFPFLIHFHGDIYAYSSKNQGE